jgi:predicted PurR-regulated permease PerM
MNIIEIILLILVLGLYLTIYILWRKYHHLIENIVPLVDKYGDELNQILPLIDKYGDDLKNLNIDDIKTQLSDVQKITSQLQKNVCGKDISVFGNTILSIPPC